MLAKLQERMLLKEYQSKLKAEKSKQNTATTALVFSFLLMTTMDINHKKVIVS